MQTAATSSSSARLRTRPVGLCGVLRSSSRTQAALHRGAQRVAVKRKSGGRSVSRRWAPANAMHAE